MFDLCYCDKVEQFKLKFAKLAQVIKKMNDIVPKRPFGLPFYYGWVIVAAGFMSTFINSGVAFWGFQVFVGPMQEDTGWSRAAIMGALTLRWIVGAIVGLLAGHYFDRKGGPKVFTLVGTLIDGGSMMCLFWARSSLDFILLFGVLGGIGSLGTGRLLSAVLVPKWFVARRGLAMGIAAAGSGASALLFGPFADAINQAAGWRVGWVWMGMLTLALLLPFVPFVHGSPEDIGLQPDGDHVPKPARHGRAQLSVANERNYSLDEAKRAPTLWVLTLAMSIGLFSVSTTSSSIVPLFHTMGYPAQIAAWGLGLYGLFSFLSRFFWGAIADRFSVRHALMLQGACTSVSVALCLAITSQVQLFAACAFLGLALGGFLVLQPLVWPDYFGRKHLGAITALTQFITTFPQAVGPFFAGIMFDATGSYSWVYHLLIVTWSLGAALTFLVRPMRDRTAEPAVIG